MRRKNNAGTDKEENKLAGPLAKKELLAEGWYIRNGTQEEGSQQKKILNIDNIMINGLYADMKRKAEKKVGWRMLSLQGKLYPWAEYYH